MQRLFLFSLIFLTFFGLLASTAEAARFGGGRSFGMQRSIGNYSRYQQAAPRAIPAQRAPRNNWVAPLAGLAIGGLLASLFMGHGLGTGILTWLALIGIISFIWNIAKSKSAATQNNHHSYSRQGNIIDVQPYTADYSHTQTSGFNPEIFLRDAKVQFIRLQAAYDTKDLNDLCEFTAPEVFAEIQMQLQERGDVFNRTEVVSLEAELLDLATEANNMLASVKFSGMIKEAADAPAAFFAEIWHFRKSNLGNKWIVAGVQQA
ncbi:MAG TPA: TIM44-like domain-containing protein [Gammaproteobacteria bacterium]|nr:TIM44-like domain-containing protein [Gammaproteobacteria bacterium]